MYLLFCAVSFTQSSKGFQCEHKLTCANADYSRVETLHVMQLIRGISSQVEADCIASKLKCNRAERRQTLAYIERMKSVN